MAKSTIGGGVGVSQTFANFFPKVAQTCERAKFREICARPRVVVCVCLDLCVCLSGSVVCRVSIRTHNGLER